MPNVVPATITSCLGTDAGSELAAATVNPAATPPITAAVSEVALASATSRVTYSDSGRLVPGRPRIRGRRL